MSIPLWEECSWNKGFEKIEIIQNHLDNLENEKLVDLDSFERADDNSIDGAIETEHKEDEDSSSFENNSKNAHSTENSESNNASLHAIQDPLTSINLESKEKIKEKDISKQYQFQYNYELNQKIYLYFGDIYKIPADAIVIGQNESLRDPSEGNDAIIALAGPQLELELQELAPVSTGESAITSGWALPCNWIIHSVGPKYDPKYLIASEHSLFSAYKSALLLATDPEKNIKSIIFNCIYKIKKNYPRFDAAHIALRTIRKFLDHSISSNIEKLMFCVPTQDDYEIYSALLSAYFPRSEEELASQKNLIPSYTGDEWGDIVLPERTLKVSAGPKPLPEDLRMRYGRSLSEGDRNEYEPTKKSGNNNVQFVGDKPRRMSDIDFSTDDLRKKKVQQDLAKLSQEERLKIKYKYLVEEVMEDEDMDLSDIEAMDFIQFSGEDYQGRTVVFITAANLKKGQYDQERVLYHLIKVMEPLRCVPFVLVYAVSGMTEENSPEPAFLQNVFDLFSSRYRENLQMLFILHASFMFRLYFWIGLPFLATPFWKNYISVRNLKDLGKYMKVASQDLPSLVSEYDEHYFGSKH